MTDLSDAASALATTLAALAGVFVVLVGLGMSRQAFQDLRKTKPKDKPNAGPSKYVEIGGLTVATAEPAPGEALINPIPIGDVTKVLADLVKTSAGVAVAVLLLGVVLLVGSAFAPTDNGTAESTPTSSPSATP
jgi:hypothetical protein